MIDPDVRPCIMVIFGGSGDLTMRKLVPALYHLERDGLLPRRFAVVAVSRKEMTHEEFRERLRTLVPGLLGSEKMDLEAWERLLSGTYCLGADVSAPEGYQKLGNLLQELDRKHQTEGNVIFYLATPPTLFAPIIERLGEAKLTEETGNRSRRVVIEKPFGRDLESAHMLNEIIRRTLDEHQVFRIDHYLGKETVQNIMVFRFANGIFEPIWNRRYVDSVQITVAERLGVEERGGYYETSGALRDMVPNHMFQLMSMIAMEPPISFDADDVRDEKFKVIKAIKPLSHEEVLSHCVRGQYGPGIIDGRPVPGYRQEPQVAPTSNTETFAAMRLFIDNWRWAGIPFYLRTGKRLAQRVTEICIQFREVPLQLFRETEVVSLRPNLLIMQIQPEEKISLCFGAKVPGPVVHIGDVTMDFKYQEHFGNRPSTGYETLIYDCMKGDATLFQRGDHVECAWAVIQPVLDVWTALKPREFPNYPAGSWGPREADELLARDGRAWRVSNEAAAELPELRRRRLSAV